MVQEEQSCKFNAPICMRKDTLHQYRDIDP